MAQESSLLYVETRCCRTHMTSVGGYQDPKAEMRKGEEGIAHGKGGGEMGTSKGWTPASHVRVDIVCYGSHCARNWQENGDFSELFLQVIDCYSKISMLFNKPSIKNSLKE